MPGWIVTMVARWDESLWTQIIFLPVSVTARIKPEWKIKYKLVRSGIKQLRLSHSLVHPLATDLGFRGNRARFPTTVTGRLVLPPAGDPFQRGRLPTEPRRRCSHPTNIHKQDIGWNYKYSGDLGKTKRDFDSLADSNVSNLHWGQATSVRYEFPLFANSSLLFVIFNIIVLSTNGTSPINCLTYLSATLSISWNRPPCVTHWSCKTWLCRVS